MVTFVKAGLFGIFIMCWSMIANATDISLRAFEGVWEGSSVSESSSSTAFPVSVRDLDVEIRNDTEGGFRLVWSTLQRQKGNPSNPNEVVKKTERYFVPKVPGKVWHMSPQENLYEGGVVSWASLQEQTLTVYSMSLREAGGYDMLIYSRSLTGLNMKLDFRAMRNGEVRRIASGTLIKSAD